MKKIIIPFFSFGILFTSCSKEEVPTEEKASETVVEEVNLEVEKFMYTAMNEIYLYKSQVTELADNYFETTTARNSFLASFDSPEDLYYDGLVWSKDNFSFMTADYVALEKLLKEGVSGTTGMEYRLHVFSNDHDIYGYVRYVLKESSAEAGGIVRGDFFTEIDGETLNRDNYQRLLGQQSFAVRLATISGGTISQTDKVVQLHSEEVAEDPVFIAKVFEEEGRRIGYLMYNSFTPSFDVKLNQSFAEFQTQGVTDLILDVRYNGGGDVETAIDLAGMITGQFNDEIILKYQYNEKYQSYFEKNRPEELIKRFNNTIRTGENLNSLTLSKVHVITTRSSASASELVIHALEPYIEVIQIGNNTRGKFQASSTFYDSPNLRKYDKDGNFHANINHTYAIQPLIVKYANSNGESDFINGLYPDVEVSEDLGSLGVLGDRSETLLNAAINHILGKQQEAVATTLKKVDQSFKIIGESKMFNPNFQRMYIDSIPGLIEIDK